MSLELRYEAYNMQLCNITYDTIPSPPHFPLLCRSWLLSLAVILLLSSQGVCTLYISKVTMCQRKWKLGNDSTLQSANQKRVRVKIGIYTGTNCRLLKERSSSRSRVQVLNLKFRLGKRHVGCRADDEVLFLSLNALLMTLTLPGVNWYVKCHSLLLGKD